MASMMDVYEVLEHPDFPGQWNVERIDPESGECEVAMFTGPRAEERAREYAGWMNAGGGYSPDDALNQ